MTNKIEISRELAERLTREFSGKSSWDALETVRMKATEELRVLLAAPAVERQCCAPTDEEKDLLANGDYTPEELWGGSRPTCPRCTAPAVERQAEPAAWIKFLKGAECKSDGRTYDLMFCAMPGYAPLYTSPPAPVAVALPERRDLSGKMFEEMSPSERDISFKDIGWNACLDRVKELNQ